MRRVPWVLASVVAMLVRRGWLLPRLGPGDADLGLVATGIGGAVIGGLVPRLSPRGPRRRRGAAGGRIAPRGRGA